MAYIITEFLVGRDMKRPRPWIALCLCCALVACAKHATEDVPPAPRSVETSRPAPTDDAPAPSASTTLPPWPELHELGETAPSWHDTPVGNAEVGIVTAKGGRVLNAEAVVSGMRAGFRHCYYKALIINNTMRGSLRIAAQIGARGEVVSVNVSGGEGLSPELISCVAARVSTAVFAAPPEGAAAVLFPIGFTAM